MLSKLEDVLQRNRGSHHSALIWEGNFWDDYVHDYTELSWKTMISLMEKIENLLRQKTHEGDCLLLLLPTVVQLPLTLLAASRSLRLPLLVNAADESLSVERLSDVLKESRATLAITVDAFWQGHTLLETKKMLDAAVEEAGDKSLIKEILVIGHCGSSPSMPPPQIEYPGRRPCYSLKVPMKEGRDVEWSKLVMVIPLQERHDTSLIAQHSEMFQLPSWNNGTLSLTTVTWNSALASANLLAQKICLGWTVLVECGEWKEDMIFSWLAVLLNSSKLVIFEGILHHPDPSRLGRIINKFEVDTLLFSSAVSLDREYLSFFPFPSLTTVAASSPLLQMAKHIFKDAKHFVDITAS